MSKWLIGVKNKTWLPIKWWLGKLERMEKMDGKSKGEIINKIQELRGQAVVLEREGKSAKHFEDQIKLLKWVVGEV